VTAKLQVDHETTVMDSIVVRTVTTRHGAGLQEASWAGPPTLVRQGCVWYSEKAQYRLWYTIDYDVGLIGVDPKLYAWPPLVQGKYLPTEMPGDFVPMDCSLSLSDIQRNNS